MARLTSTKEIQGYELGAQYGRTGKCSDCLVDDRSWTVRYMVGDTCKWLPGSRRVIISPQWVDRVEWDDGKVVVRVSSVKITKCPDYDPPIPYDRDYETALYNFYGFWFY